MRAQELSIAVGDILGNIESGLVSRILSSRYNGDESKVPTESYLARKPVVSKALDFEKYGIRHSETKGSEGSTIHVYDITKELPAHGEWLETLAGPKSNWLRAFLTNLSIVQGNRIVENQAARVFRPRPKQRVKIAYGENGEPTKVEVRIMDAHRFRLLSAFPGLWCDSLVRQTTTL